MQWRRLFLLYVPCTLDGHFVLHSLSFAPYLIFAYTCTDTLVSGQLYLRTLFSNSPFYLPVKLYIMGIISKGTAQLTNTFSNPRGCPLTRELTVVCIEHKSGSESLKLCHQYLCCWLQESLLLPILFSTYSAKT